MSRKPYRIVYDFKFSDQRCHRFEIHLDPRHLSLVRPTSTRPPPAWTNLSFEQCRCCPLSSERVRDCPVAVNIADIAEAFKDRISSESCTVRCAVKERNYFKKTSLMEGLSSLFGVVMATSGCPVMNFFKPMARFHLPFSTSDESTIRAVSMFLLRTYLQRGNKEDFQSAMKDLERRYARVRQVNEGLFARITHVGSEDADKNAIVMLHSLSQLLGMELEGNFDSIAGYFNTADR